MWWRYSSMCAQVAASTSSPHVAAQLKKLRRCGRRPDRRPCPGHLSVLRMDIPPSIEWRSTSCCDDGVISGWERSPFDLRPRSIDPGPTEAVRALTPAEVAATLRGLMLLDTACERLVFRAGAADEGVVLSG
jgi:hypothetical protein